MIDSISNQQNTWIHTTLSEFCGQRGQSIEPSKTPDSQFELYSIPSFPTGQPEIVSGKQVGSNKQMVTSECVLLSKINPRINRVWVVGHFSRHTKIASTEWIVFPPDKRVEPKFLCYFLQQNAVRDFLASNVSGVGGSLMRVKPSTLRDFPFAYPGRDEQSSIVEEIEKQFSRLDEAVANLKRVKANLKRYKASVLKAAVEGKLTEEWRKAHPDIEPASKLLQHILAERRTRCNVRGKYKEPAKPDMSNLPPLPEKWTWASVDQLTAHITSGSRDWTRYYGRGIGTFILAQNVRLMRLDLSERQAVDPPKSDAETARTRVSIGDLLVTIVGAKTGEVCRIPMELVDHFVCQSVALLRPLMPASAKFMELYLASPENGQAQWKHYIYGQGRPHLSFEQLKMTAIALPPLAEQQQIVAEAERRLSIIEELEAAVQANLTRADRLRQSILSQAFSGRLVGQDSKNVHCSSSVFSVAAESLAGYGNSEPANR